LEGGEDVTLSALREDTLQDRSGREGGRCNRARLVQKKRESTIAKR